MEETLSTKAVVHRAPPKKPAPAPVPTEELTCTNCGDTWVRERAQGRKPKLCPQCTGVTSTTAVRHAATEAEVNDRLDNLERNLKANGSHLSQQPEVRRSFTVQDMDARISALESLADDLDERLSKLEEGDHGGYVVKRKAAALRQEYFIKG